MNNINNNANLWSANSKNMLYWEQAHCDKNEKIDTASNPEFQSKTFTRMLSESARMYK